MAIDNIVGGFIVFLFGGSLYNFIFYQLSITYTHRHYITKVYMVSVVWYNKGGFFGWLLAFCACERVKQLVLSVNPELGVFGFG